MPRASPAFLNYFNTRWEFFQGFYFDFFSLIIGLRQKNVSIALCAAGVAKAVTVTEFCATVMAEVFDKLRAGRFRCFIHRRTVGIYRESFVMAKMSATTRAVYESVRIPGAEIEIDIGVIHFCLAGFAGLPVGESAMPFCSLVSHISLPFIV
jgi:hypothetical protein